MIGFYIFLAILFIDAVITFAFAYMIFYRVSVRKKPRKNEIDSLFTQNKIELAGRENIQRNLDWIANAQSESVCIESEDGLRLHCSLINVDKEIVPKGVIIIFHGYRSFGARDFCMQLPMLHEAGYNIMLVDQRSHAKSEGKYICYGTKEHKDALLWRKKASEIYGNDIPIALFGLSMGAATVLMASGDIDSEDSQVKCVIADCPFYDTYGIIKHVLWKYNKIYPQPIIHFVNFWSRFLADFNMHAPSCVEKAKASRLPFLIFHGKDDKFVPTKCSERIAEELGEQARLVLVENARHAESVYYSPELYKAELLGFLQKYMN